MAERETGDVTMSGEELQYPDDFVQRLETIWGNGFLSPGGPEEVGEIVKGVALAGQHVLDIGCGTGGPAIVLTRDLGAAHVTAIDIEAPLLTRAEQNAQEAHVAAKTTFQLVEPGPLPFPDGTFDIVFSKDALIHIEDKAALYRDVLRVLRPGGIFVASDWLGGENTENSPEFAKFRDLGHLKFAMATGEETATVMRRAGFTEVATRDRNAWYAKLSQFEYEQIAGPLREQLIEAVGEDVHSHWIKVRRALADATAVGALRPTHLRGVKPAIAT
ncbi:MAG: methyltransferase domain-containing protein [Hyphomicrobiaceae bacterium]